MLKAGLLILRVNNSLQLHYVKKFLKKVYENIIINKLLDHTSPVKAKTPETHPTSDVQINGKNNVIKELYLFKVDKTF